MKKSYIILIGLVVFTLFIAGCTSKQTSPNKIDNHTDDGQTCSIEANIDTPSCD